MTFQKAPPGISLPSRVADLGSIRETESKKRDIGTERWALIVFSITILKIISYLPADGKEFFNIKINCFARLNYKSCYPRQKSARPLENESIRLFTDRFMFVQRAAVEERMDTSTKCLDVYALCGNVP